MNAVIDALAGLTLLRPWWLLVLLPLAWLAWRVRREFSAATSGAAAAAGVWAGVVDPALRPAVLVGGRRRTEPATLRLLALLPLVLVLAGPAIRSTEPPAELAYRRDALRVLVVDASPAMLAGVVADGAASPAERARGALLQLLATLPSGQTALIAYAEEPYLIAPPTSDAATIALLVPELDPAVMPLAGDRPERALRLAAELIARSAAESRDLIWLSNRADLPAPAATALRTLDGVRVSALQLGADEQSVLRDLAAASGGRYLQLAGDGRVPVELNALLAAGSGWNAEARRGVAGELVDLGPWLLLLALPLAALALGGALPIGRSPRLLAVAAAAALVAGLPAPMRAEAADPAARAPGAAVAVSAAAGAVTGALANDSARLADPRWRAVAAYRAGDFAGAAAALAGLDEPDAHYNRGNALAHAGDLHGALAAFEASLALRPGDADTLHNRDLVLELLAPPPSPPASDLGAEPPPSPAQSPPSAPPPTGADHRREAESLASQWLRRPPDDPGGILQRKLQQEHRRRQAAAGRQSWQ